MMSYDYVVLTAAPESVPHRPTNHWQRRNRTATVVWSLSLLWSVSLAAPRAANPAFPATEDTLAVALNQSTAPDAGILVLAGSGGIMAGALGGGGH
jgi:hypothetical protein